jgi:hypothetical protein
MTATERLRYLEQRMGKAQHNKGTKQSNEPASEEQSKEAEVSNGKAQATRAEEHRGPTEFAEGKDAGAYNRISIYDTHNRNSFFDSQSVRFGCPMAFVCACVYYVIHI